MKTIIIVEGKRYEATYQLFGYYDEQDQYHAISQSEIEGIEYEGRFEPVIELINKRIEAHEELLAEYETELMQEYRVNLKAPFASDKMRDLAEKHAIMSNVVDGLHEALGIVVQDIHMVDDVDLSGGEEEC